MRQLNFMFKAAVIYSLSVFSSYAIAAQKTATLTQQFNDTKTGIAFTMLSKASWKNPANQNFHNSPTTPQKKLQAVTISNAGKKIMPYQGDTRYGLAFSMTESSGFYQYFATKSQFSTSCKSGNGKMVSPITKSPAKQYSNITNWAVSCDANDKGEQIAFCGRCYDGGVCAGSGNIPNTPDKLWPALGDQVSFAEFQMAKNAIVDASGQIKTCQWASAPAIWNEFDTNGLSPTALAGVLIDDTSQRTSWTPPDTTLCSYLKAVDSSRKNWPVYTLSFTQSSKTPSQLKLTRTLSCK